MLQPHASENLLSFCSQLGGTIQSLYRGQWQRKKLCPTFLVEECLKIQGTLEISLK